MYLRNRGAPTKAVGSKAIIDTLLPILDSPLLQLAPVLTEEPCLMCYPDRIPEGSEPWILTLLMLWWLYLHIHHYNWSWGCPEMPNGSSENLTCFSLLSSSWSSGGIYLIDA